MTLAERLPGMARHAQRRALCEWPAWSTGETLAVALVLNRHDVLTAEGYTMAQTFARLAGELSAIDMVCIERALHD